MKFFKVPFILSLYFLSFSCPFLTKEKDKEERGKMAWHHFLGHPVACVSRGEEKAGDGAHRHQ
jgi:hypothetical protein